MKLVDLRQNILLFFPNPIELLRVIQYRDNVRRRHRFDRENNNHDTIPDSSNDSALTFPSNVAIKIRNRKARAELEFPIFILFFSCQILQGGIFSLSSAFYFLI